MLLLSSKDSLAAFEHARGVLLADAEVLLARPECELALQLRRGDAWQAPPPLRARQPHRQENPPPSLSSGHTSAQ